MRVAVLSDLHLDHNGGFDNIARKFDMSLKDYVEQINKRADLIIFAGDIGTPEMNDKLSTTFSIPTVCLYGNHEYYDNVFTDYQIPNGANGKPKTYRFTDPNTGEDVYVVAATLWTDFYEDDPFVKMRYPVCLNDCRWIRYSKKVKWSAWRALAQHYHDRNYIGEALHDLKGKKVIVATHHAPSYKSVSPKYHGAETNPYYCSNLEYLVEKCDLWVHGHTHSNHDYRVGEARVVCNPHGYGNENPNFELFKIVEV